MRTRLVLLSLSLVGLAGLGSFACGGNDKPPLTPDVVESPADVDAEAPATSSTATTPAPTN